MSIYIDKYQFRSIIGAVTARLPIAVESSAESSCCAPRARIRGKAVKQFASLFKGLADETRLEILGLLAAARGEVCACHIEEHIKHLSQPTISHHLRLLREAGLVTAERRGTWVYYTLDKSLLSRVKQFVEAIKE
jgi:ArsR family transcriptional regulator